MSSSLGSVNKASNEETHTIINKSSAEIVSMALGKTDKKIVYIDKTRQQIALQAENLSDGFRGSMIAASILATIAVAVKIAIVVGAVGLAVTPVGWVFGGLAIAITAIALGILLYRHFSAREDGYKPKSLQEFGIGMAEGALAGIATAVTIFVCACIAAAFAGCNGGGGGGGFGGGGGGCRGGGGGSFLRGFALGYSTSHLCRPCVIRPHYCGVWHHSPLPTHIGKFNSSSYDASNERFENNSKVQYLYKGDQVVLPKKQAGKSS